MKKIRVFKQLAAILLLSLLFVAASLTYLATTSSGLRQLLDLAQRGLPGTLQVAEVEGTLFDQLTLKGLRFSQQGLDVSIARLHLAWAPRALLSGMLHIKTLEIIQPEIRLPAAEPPSAASSSAFPITVADLNLPLRLRLDRFSLQQLSLLQAPPEGSPALDGQPSSAFVIESLLLQAHSGTQTLVVDQFQLNAPQGVLQLQGQLTPSGQFPLQLTMDWTLRLPGYAALTGRGTLSGDLSALLLEQQLSGLLSARVSAKLESPLESPKGALQVDAFRADLEPLQASLKGHVVDGSFNAEGDLQGLDLNGQWQTSLPELGDLGLAVQLRLTPERLELNALTVKQLTSGAEFLIEGEIDSYLQSPLLALKGGWKNLAYPLQGDALVSSPQGQFSIDGTLQGVQLALRSDLQGPPELGESLLDARLQLSEELLQLEKLVITQKTTGAQLQLQGRVAQLQQTPQIAMTGSWLKLRYPLQGDALIASSAGGFTFEGTPAQYQLALNSELAGSDLPTGQWRLQAQGNEQGFSQFALGAKTLDGTLQAEGRIGWLPGLSWQVALHGRQLNPGRHWPDWPGALDLQAATHGRLAAGQPLQLEVELESLSGTLRDQPLQGHARIELEDTELKIQQLQLAAAGAQVTLSGTLNGTQKGTENGVLNGAQDEQFDLDWSVDAPDLERLLPNARGSLVGNGTLRGPKQQLELKAVLQGRELKFDAQQLASLDAELDIDLSGRQTSSITLQAENLQIGTQVWQTLDINGQGTPQQHRLELQLEQGPAELQLTLSGGWQAPQWRGVLSRLDLNQELAGRWLLQSPVAVEASAEQAAMAGACWEHQPAAGGELCLDSRWSLQDGVVGALQARQLGLKLLDPWLPPGTQVEGVLELLASFAQKPGEHPRYQLSARLVGSELVLEDEDLKVVGGEIRFNLNGNNDQLGADLLLPLRYPIGSLHTQFSIDNLYTRPGVNGQLDLAVSELKFISLFAPQLQAVSGQIESVLSVSGPLDQPQVQGYLQLFNASAEVPALGIKLEAIELALRDRPESAALDLSGSLRSGSGNLQLEGQLFPLARTGQLRLNGERFKAVDTREVKAWISPDIEIAIAPKLIQLRGEVTIPEAKITPPPLTFNTPLSADVVILDPQQSQTRALVDRQALDAQLRLTLGDKVEVDALGFKGRLEGSILLEDDDRRATRATGSMRVAAGKYRLYGQDMNIERGSLVFSGGPVDNPGLDLRVSRKVEEVTAGARVSGTLRAPRLTLFSEPVMPESSLLSYLLFGRPPGAESTTPSEQELLLKAAIALATMGGNSVAENMSETFSIDELGFESSDDNNTSFYIGKYLSPKLYVKYGVGLLEPTNTFFMRYRLNKGWSLESQTGTQSNGGDIVYTLER